MPRDRCKKHLYDDVLGDAGLYGSAIDHLGEKQPNE